MSRSPYFFVEKYNKNTNRYELQHPLIWNDEHTAQELADLFPYNGCHNVFAIVEKNGCEFPSMCGIHIGLPDNVSTEIKEIYDKCSYTTNSTEVIHLYTPTAYWFTYADMYIYYLENPTAIDYEAMEEQDNDDRKPIMMPNPIKILMDRVDAFLSVTDAWGNWHDDYSQIRIVYWIE